MIGRKTFVEWLTNEMLFYGGIIITIISLIIFIIYLCITQIIKIQLNAKMDIEYGEKEE